MKTMENRIIYMAVIFDDCQIIIVWLYNKMIIDDN